MTYEYPKGVDRTAEFDTALDKVTRGVSNLFITGQAGTGKSTLLQCIKHNLGAANVVTLAPTGLAAVHVGGQTIHSFFRFPPKLLTRADITPERRRMSLVRALDVLIIDEISMVRADVMDAIDVYCQMARRSSKPFGGIRLIIIGDTCQLPPVVRKNEERYLTDTFGGCYFFHADGYRRGDFDVIELEEVHRQHDPLFLAALNGIRVDSATDEHLEALNQTVRKFDPALTEDHTVLVPTNAAAEQINRLCLSMLPGDTETFAARMDGDFRENDRPTDLLLELKPGAKVVLLNNDPNHNWVNGTRATISQIVEGSIWVDIDGTEFPLARKTWERLIFDYDPKTKKIKHTVAGSFTQFPLRLAWALTIHKSQGMTLDKVFVNFGRGTFAHGQAYVALSRCRSLEGLAMSRPFSVHDIIFDPDCLGYAT